MSKREPRKKRVVLFGTHGQHNLGDELLLATFLNELGHHHEYVINTYDTDDTRSRLPATVQATLIRTDGDRFKLVKLLWGSDVLVFAGGSILKELSKATGRFRYSTLFMVAAVTWFAWWVARTPVAFLNIGVGPVHTRVGRSLVKFILDQASLVTVRDHASLTLCGEAQVRTPVIESTDAVFATTPARSDRQRSAPAIGLNLNHDISTPENWGHVVDTFTEVLRRLANQYPTLVVHTIPMQSKGKLHTDKVVLHDLARSLPEVTFVEHEPDTVEDVISILDKCDLVVSARLHALILSAMRNIPIVPLMYDVKVRELARTLGLGAVSVDLDTELDPDQISDTIDGLLRSPETLTEQLRFRVSQAHRTATNHFMVATQWVNR